MYLKDVDHDPYDPHQHDFGCYVIFKGKMQSFTLQIFYIPHLTGAHLTGCLLQFFFNRCSICQDIYLGCTLLVRTLCHIRVNTLYMSIHVIILFGSFCLQRNTTTGSCALECWFFGLEI